MLIDIFGTFFWDIFWDIFGTFFGTLFLSVRLRLVSREMLFLALSSPKLSFLAERMRFERFDIKLCHKTSAQAKRHHFFDYYD